MPKMGYGLTVGGLPALRVAFDKATDLVNEPASSVGKFKFDSLNGTKLSYVYDIYLQGYDSRYDAGGSSRYYCFYNHNFDLVVSNNYDDFRTAGAGVFWNQAGQGQQTIYYWQNWWNFGFMPIMEQRSRFNMPANTFQGARVIYQFFSGLDGQYGLVESYAAYDGRTAVLASGNVGTTIQWREAYQYQTQSSNNSSITRVSSMLTTFQLPLRNDPLPDFSAAPVSGQQALLLTPTTARLALPGRTVSDPDVDHYTFHEDKIPAKIMAAGDINVGGTGTVDILCPLPLTPYTYMDFHVRKQADAEFWHPPFYNGVSSNGNYAFTYFVDIPNQKITITNGTGTPLVVRYVIHADAEVAPTTGGKKVFYKGNDGTQDFIQIKRPGSSDLAPNLNDIIVDTRLAYLPILAQGFLNWPGDFPTVISGSERYKGERMASIAINNPSPKLKLFCKQIVCFDPLSSPVAARSGYHRVFADNTGGWIGRASCESSWARIYADETGVDFYMSGDNPQNVMDGGAASYVKKMTGNSSSVQVSALGLRYYIFGIPQSL